MGDRSVEDEQPSNRNDFLSKLLSYSSSFSSSSILNVGLSERPRSGLSVCLSVGLTAARCSIGLVLEDHVSQMFLCSRGLGEVEEEEEGPQLPLELRSLTTLSVEDDSPEVLRISLILLTTITMLVLMVVCKLDQMLDVDGAVGDCSFTDDCSGFGSLGFSSSFVWTTIPSSDFLKTNVICGSSADFVVTSFVGDTGGCNELFDEGVSALLSGFSVTVGSGPLREDFA